MAVGGEEQGQNKESTAVVDKSDITYPVKVRGAVFGYFAHKLTPVYNKELANVRKEGSFAGIEELHKSQFGRLMTKVLDQYQGEYVAKPQNIELNMSKSDVELILKKAKASNQFGAYQLHCEMINDLKSSFQSAKLKQAEIMLATEMMTEEIGTLSPEMPEGKKQKT